MATPQLTYGNPEITEVNLVEKFDIKPTGSAQEDIEAMMRGE